MYLATAPQVRLLVSSKHQPLKNDSINPRPQARRPGLLTWSELSKDWVEEVSGQGEAAPKMIPTG
jgi:hypothetical protein